MQEKILQEYEKIKDKLSEEEFLEEIERLKSDSVDVIDDYEVAQMVVQNYVDEENLPFDETEEFKEKFDKVKDQISKEEFLSRMEEIRQKESHNPFMNDSSIADMVVGEYVTEEPEVISEKPEYAVDSIDKLEANARDVSVAGRVMTISNPKSFTTRKGKDGEVCNIELADNTGNIRAVFWNQNIKLLDNVNEGDIIQIAPVDIKEGYTGLEANLRPRSTVVKVDEDPSKYPTYQEDITKIIDIQPDTKVNIIARIVRISTVRKYEKNGKEGKVRSIELQDDSGKISYTLWNKNVELVEELKLEDGDSVKVLQAQARQRQNIDGEDEISLTHWDGRIIKGDFDVPEIQQEFTPIGDVSEEKDVSILGVVSKLQDIRVFNRKSDNTEGKLRNFDVRDSTGEIRVTVWGDDTGITINKGDFIKVIGGDIRYDEYTQSQYSMNTNFNTQITVNPENLPIETLDELDAIKEELHPIPLEEVQSEFDEDGEEIDIIGRILSLENPREFQRDDGNIGIVRSAVFADNTGKVNLSFWNEKAEGNYAVGEAYRIENARIRLGMYSVDLNVGGSSRMIRLSEKQASAMFIPELSTLEKLIYEKKKIDDLDEDEEDTIIIGRVIELSDIRTFERDNGSTGSVRNVQIADDTGSINVVLWDKDSEMALEIGQPIKIQNPRLSLDMDNRLQASVSGATTVLEPTEQEASELPSQEELMESIFVSKPIEALLEDDTNVRITATIKEVFSDRILLKKCPNCKENVEESEEEYICSNCGHTFDEPAYTLMIPTRVEDETGEISVTFFGDLAEQLIEKDIKEIISLIDDGYGIEDKLEDLVGMTVEIIANVSFDNYSEENRLTPKKLLKKYY